MNFHGLDLNLLQVLDAVYKEGSLTAAADRLSLSQPAVSHALRRLRESLDDPLFVRTAEGMIPTAYTESVIGPVTEALASLHDSLSSRMAFDTGSTHRFRLMMGDYNGTLVLPDLLETLERQAPGVTLVNTHVDRTSACERLRSGHIDLVITTDLEGPGLYQQLLFEDRYLTLMRPELLGQRAELTLERFCEIPQVLFSLEGKGSSNVDVALAALGRKRRVVLRAPHVSVIPDVLIRTNALATLPSRVALPYAERYGLAVFEPPVELDSFPVYQYWHSRQQHDPANRWLRGVLKDMLDSGQRNQRRSSIE